jgi:uncharacterized repeat protein (TIGR04052 family)
MDAPASLQPEQDTLMSFHTLNRSIAALVATLGLAACGSDDGPQAVAIEFGAFSGTTAIKCGTAVAGLGSGAVTAQVKDFRFYVTNVRMVKADGTEVPLTLGANDDWNLTVNNDRVTLIDLEDGSGSCTEGTAATNTSVKGTVPAGDYVGVKMTMGVPFAFNHSDYASATRPLDVQAMAWSWQSGRKFAKIEVTDPDGATGTWASKTFNFHLGSTGCTGNPASGQTVSCTAPNRMNFGFASFDPTTQKVAVDVKALLAGTDITVNKASAPGCMSGGTDPECLRVFESLAIDWKADGSGSGLPISGGAAQTLFRAVAK